MRKFHVGNHEFLRSRQSSISLFHIFLLVSLFRNTIFSPLLRYPSHNMAPLSRLAFVLLPSAISAVTLDCDHIRIDKQSFTLSALAGPKTVHQTRSTPPSITNTTFTIDLCDPLRKLSDVPKEEQCQAGTRVCAVEEIYNPVENVRTIGSVRAIAGEFSASHGRALDPEVERLKESSNDETMEGLRVKLHGGKYPDARGGLKQMAVIELLCDKELTGNEGFGEDEAVVHGAMQRREKSDEEDGGPALPDQDKGKSLQFVSYKTEGKGSDEQDVLRLTWKTKYACENAEAPPNKSPSGGDKTSGWGFFTWFFIVVFLLVAAYIIFGSWLNYNRYGARGWDLIPHGDTIRDIPYIVKEWTGEVVERVKGSRGSRGGYSAV